MKSIAHKWSGSGDYQELIGTDNRVIATIEQYKTRSGAPDGIRAAFMTGSERDSKLFSFKDPKYRANARQWVNDQITLGKYALSGRNGAYALVKNPATRGGGAVNPVISYTEKRRKLTNDPSNEYQVNYIEGSGYNKGHIKWQHKEEWGDSPYKREFATITQLETFLIERYGARFATKTVKALKASGKVVHHGAQNPKAAPAKTGLAGNPRGKTIYEALADKLGRTPTNAELKADVQRIKTEALVEAASKGKLQHQRRGASRGRRNPDTDSTAAADMYETFHGKPSTGSVDYSEDYYEPDAYAELGDLIELWLIPIHSKSDKAQKIESANPDTANASDVVKLACSPDGTQLYFIGGDQGIDLDALGFEDSETRQHMMLGVLSELTYRAKKGFHKFKLTDYFHKLGEDSGNEPFLCYDPHSQKLTVVGGSYKVKDVGIVD